MLVLATNLIINVGCVCVGFLIGLQVMYRRLKTGLDKELEEKMGGFEEWEWD